MASVQEQRRLTSKGDTAFANMEKVNAELFVMTYGAIVIQLIKDIGDICLFVPVHILCIQVYMLCDIDFIIIAVEASRSYFISKTRAIKKEAISIQSISSSSNTIIL